MATLTTNYHLTKPDITDAVSIADINGNMDTIDAQLKSNANDISEHDSNTKIHITDSERSAWNGKLDKSGGTITGKVDLTPTAEFKFVNHAERRFTGLSPSPTYNNWDANKKDGKWHRIWRISFPSNSNFWGRRTIGMVGQYSSFNASGYMEKEINLAFNTSSCYNNVGRYIALGGNVEKDFRISEAIWNSNTSKWEILIYSNVPNGNNAPSSLVLRCETNSPSYMSAFENITVSSNCEISDIVTYDNVRGRFDGSTLVKSFKDLPVYESPYGYPIITSNELNAAIDAHKSDTVSHITADERTKWDAMLPLAGGTMTGNLTVGSASIGTNGYIQGTWLKTTGSIHSANAPADYPVLSGGWIYSRTKAEMKSDLGIDDKLNQSGGTMTGALVAQSNTNYDTAQIRNVIISTSDPSGGSSGDIWIKYA